MKGRLNAFAELMVRTVDGHICRKQRCLLEVPLPVRMRIVARCLTSAGLAVVRTEPDGAEMWLPSQVLEAQMGKTEFAEPFELDDIEVDVMPRRQTLRYVEAARKETVVFIEPVLPSMIADIIAFNKGYTKLVGWDESGEPKWAKTSLGREVDSW